MAGGGGSRKELGAPPSEGARPAPRHSGMRPGPPLHEGPAGQEQELSDAAIGLLRAGHLFCKGMKRYRTALMRACRERKHEALGKVERDLLLGQTTADEDLVASTLRMAHLSLRLEGGESQVYRPDSVSVMQMLVDEGMSPDTAASLIARLALLGLVDFEMPNATSLGFTEDGPPTRRE